MLFLNENEFATSGDVVFRESAEFSIMVWDYQTGAVVSNQLYHVCPTSNYVKNHFRLILLMYFKEKFISTCLKKHPTSNLFFAQTHGNYIAEFSSRRPYKLNKFKRFEGHEVML